MSAVTIGGILALPVVVPIAMFGLYGIEQNKSHKKQAEKALSALVNSDRTESLIGQDENQNGMRDSIESFITSQPFRYPTTDALAKRFIYAYQQSMDIQNVPEFKRAAIYHDIAMVSACGDTVNKFLDGIEQDNFTTDPLLREYISNHTHMYMGFYNVNYLNTHKEAIFLNTERRKQSKQASDQLVGSKYQSSVPVLNLNLEDTARACVKFAQKTMLLQIADLDSTNSVLGLDKNEDGIRDNINHYISGISYYNAQNLAKRFSKAYLSSMDIQRVPQDKREQVYTELARGKACIQPLLDNRNKSNREFAQRIKTSQNPMDQYKALKVNVELAVALETLNIFVENADDIFINTQQRIAAKQVSDGQALQYHPKSPIFPEHITDKDKAYACETEYQ